MSGAIRVDDTYNGETHDNMRTVNGVADMGSSNVFINGKGAVTKDMTTTEICGCAEEPLTGQVYTGSNNVFVNGKAKARFGDEIQCHDGSIVVWNGTKSSDVIING